MGVGGGACVWVGGIVVGMLVMILGLLAVAQAAMMITTNERTKNKDNFLIIYPLSLVNRNQTS